MIESPTNPTIKRLVRLRKRRERDRSGRFLIEGHRELMRAHSAGITLEEVLVSPHATGDRATFADRLRDEGIRVTPTSTAAFVKASQRANPDGLLALAVQPTTTLEQLELPPAPLILVVESIEKPGNLGAMLRSADGAGADAVIVADPATDVFNPNVVRSSQGALFLVPVAVGTMPDVQRWLEQRHIRVFAADPTGAVAPWEADLCGAAAIVIGAEHAGLSAGWDGVTVSLPMRGGSDSLNASATAAVLLYEAVRQRAALG